jgi:hypothetical protein
MAMRKHLQLVAAAVPLLASLAACGLLGGGNADPDRRFLACRAMVAEHDGKKGLMVIIENSGSTAFNVEWKINDAPNIAIKKGSMIVNHKSTEQYFHEAINQDSTIVGEVVISKFVSTDDKAVKDASLLPALY